jgi:hypothetical protein
MGEETPMNSQPAAATTRVLSRDAAPWVPHGLLPSIHHRSAQTNDKCGAAPFGKAEHLQRERRTR